MAMDEVKKKIIKTLVDKNQFEKYEDLLANKDSLFVDFTHWKREFEEGKALSIPPKTGWVTFGEVNKNGNVEVYLSPRADENTSSMPRGCFMLMEDSTGVFVRVIEQAGNSGFSGELYKDELSKFFQFIDKLDNERCHDVLLCEMRVSGVMRGLVNIEECMFSADKVGMNAETFVVSISRNITEGEILVNDDNDKKIVIKENINGTIYVCSALHCSYITRDELLKSKWYILKFFDQNPEECSVSLDFMKRLKSNLENECRI